VAVQPLTQIVLWMLACVTLRLIAPGVRVWSGRTAPAALVTLPAVLSA
jgi:hypothetical protein